LSQLYVLPLSVYSTAERDQSMQHVFAVLVQAHTNDGIDDVNQTSIRLNKINR